MNINRDNYQQFFLLYADNELSVAEKNMVDTFIQQNSELEEEFMMIQQSVLHPDQNVKLGSKNFLLKQDNDFISTGNYEEVFVLYHDGQLTDSERIKTENFITAHPRLDKSFNLVKKVRMEADTSIVFPDKRLLLKKQDQGKVIPLNPWRALVAAVILGFGLWGGLKYMNQANMQETVSNNQPVTTGNSLATGQNAHLNDTMIKVSGIQKNSKEPKDQVAGKIPAEHQNMLPVKTPGKPDQLAINGQQKLHVTPLKKPLEDPLYEVVIKETVEDRHIIKKDEKILEEPIIPIKTTDEVINKSNPENFAIASSYKSEAKNDNYVFYNVSEEQFKKTRLFGLLKKVKRVIERKSPFNHEKAELAVN
ncbi:MAG: hypothetical protein ABJA57_01310 [Ginsengibacter sp.]